MEPAHISLGKIGHHGDVVLRSLSLWPCRLGGKCYMKGDLELSLVKASVALRVSGFVFKVSL